MADKDFVHQPTIVVPDRLFLIGVIYGFNAGRKTSEPPERAAQPIFSNNPNDPKRVATNSDVYLGSWLQIDCIKCGHLFSFDNPNEIPQEALTCPTCTNIVILYGSLDPQQWRIGPIKL